MGFIPKVEGEMNTGIYDYGNAQGYLQNILRNLRTSTEIEYRIFAGGGSGYSYAHVASEKGKKLTQTELVDIKKILVDLISNNQTTGMFSVKIEKHDSYVSIELESVPYGTTSK